MINLLLYTSIFLLLIVVLSFGFNKLQNPKFQKVMLNVLIVIAILVLIANFIDQSNHLNDVFKTYFYLFLSILILKFPNSNTKFRTSIIWVGLYFSVVLLSFFIFS